MQYKGIRRGIFRSRPNRFIAHVELDGRETVCHVKNTGRCRELLIPGTVVYVQKASNPERKTKYDLIAVEKGSRLINMDSQIPNRVFAAWLEEGGLPGLTLLKGEQKFGNSRLDFYLEAGARKIFAEVKGVTLEEDGVVLFPDAPTERGVKHLGELCACLEQGMEAWAVFIVQMDDVRYFTPNDRTHPAFGDALRRARDRGVRILALECRVTPDSIRAYREIPVRL